MTRCLMKVRCLYVPVLFQLEKAGNLPSCICFKRSSSTNREQLYFSAYSVISLTPRHRPIVLLSGCGKTTITCPRCKLLSTVFFKSNTLYPMTEYESSLLTIYSTFLFLEQYQLSVFKNAYYVIYGIPQLALLFKSKVIALILKAKACKRLSLYTCNQCLQMPMKLFCVYF